MKLRQWRYTMGWFSKDENPSKVADVRVTEDRGILATHTATVTLEDGTSATARGIGESGAIEAAAYKAKNPWFG
jgi:hypothetical protein